MENTKSPILTNQKDNVGLVILFTGCLFFLIYSLIEIFMWLEFQEKGMQYFDPNFFNSMVPLRKFLISIFIVPVLLGIIIWKAKTFRISLSRKMYSLTLFLVNFLLLSAIALILMQVAEGMGMFSESAKSIPGSTWTYYESESSNNKIGVYITQSMFIVFLSTFLVLNLILTIKNRQKVFESKVNTTVFYVVLNLILFLPIVYIIHNLY